MRKLLATLAVALLATLGTAAPAAAEDEEATSSGGPVAPLVIILDTSGSMNDSAGGSNKLQAAKDALSPIISEQGGGGNLGLWTYPSDDDCAPGGFLIEVGSQDSTSVMLGKLEAQGANGGTPTAQAIRGVAESLTARGIVEANLVLVSDGESNCEVDPCLAAQELNGSGFALTVQAVGFDIDSAGRQELECIASATGGRYFDVKDGDALKNVITELGTPQIAMTVRSNPTPIAGGATAISVTITNPSALEARDVRVNLGFGDAGARTIFPAVVPPTYRVGNLPPGASVDRTWTFVAGTAGKVSDAAFTVTGWSAGNAPPAFATGTFTTKTSEYTRADLGPVFELVSAEHPLVIMGDSYSSGEGVGDYLPATDDINGDCHRSRQTYFAPMMDAAGIRVEILACSGAVSGDLPGQSNRATSQYGQLAGLGAAPGAVVMTLGGNDIGFAKIVESCVLVNCHVSQDNWRAIEGLGTPLQETYISTWNRLNTPASVANRDGAYAPLVVLAYPQITNNARFGRCGVSDALDRLDVAVMNGLALALNSKIKSAVAAVRDQGYEVYFVERTQSAFLPDHTVCEIFGDRWVNGIEMDGLSAKSESFHPNASGYASVTRLVTEWSTSVERVPPSKEAKAEAVTASTGPDLERIIADAWYQAVADYKKGGVVSTIQGSTVTVQSGGWPAGSPVTVQLRSTPMTLGSFVTGEDGAIAGDVRIPEYAELGAHHLVLMGIDESGEPVQQSVELRVVLPPPLWWYAVILGAVLALAGAVVLFLLSRRAARSREPLA